jgi:hypothetical protein
MKVLITAFALITLIAGPTFAQPVASARLAAASKG